MVQDLGQDVHKTYCVTYFFFKLMYVLHPSNLSVKRVLQTLPSLIGVSKISGQLCRVMRVATRYAICVALYELARVWTGLRLAEQ